MYSARLAPAPGSCRCGSITEFSLRSSSIANVMVSSFVSNGSATTRAILSWAHSSVTGSPGAWNSFQKSTRSVALICDSSKTSMSTACCAGVLSWYCSRWCACRSGRISVAMMLVMSRRSRKNLRMNSWNSLNSSSPLSSTSNSWILSAIPCREIVMFIFRNRLTTSACSSAPERSTSARFH